MYRWCSQCNERRRDADTVCPVCHRETDLELDVNDTLRIDSKREFIITRQLSHYTDAGMSAVYLAVRKDKPDMYGAIKIAKPARVEALQREAEHLQQLRHDNIIRLVHPERALWQDHKAGMPLHFFALEFMAGGSLKDRLNDRQKLPLDEAVPIVLAVGQALAYAHAQGFVHLDVKPANILFGADGRIVLSDFGIARSEVQATSLKKRVGTLFYNSPEQLANPPVHSLQADIYALGIILYEMLVGANRFRQSRSSSSSKEESRRSTGSLVTPAASPQYNLPPPRRLEPRIPLAVEQVILKAIAPDPVNRYNSVNAMLNDLVMAVSRPPDTKKVLLLLLAGGGILVALLLIGLGLFFWLRSGEEPPVAVSTTATPTVTAGATVEPATPLPGIVVVASTRTPTPTPSPVVQSGDSVTLAATVTRAPTGTPTPAPPPRTRPARVLPDGFIELVGPEDNTQIGDSVEFRWRWHENKGCEQPPDDYAFEIRVWRDDNFAAPKGAMDAGAQKPNISCDPATGIRSLTIGRIKSVPGFEGLNEGRFRWDVALVKLAPYEPVITTQFRAFYTN